MARILRPLERDYAETEPAYTTFDWKVDEMQYGDTVQVERDGYSRNARGFIVEDEVWFREVPPDNHEEWWNNVISEHYDRDWRVDHDPNMILYFKITGRNYFQVPFPRFHEVDKEAILRLAHFMKEFGVPPECNITWAISDIGILRNNAEDFYEII
ncbi:MAG: hypothetical protein ABEH81_01120 [Halopenitus sp.]